MADIVIRQGDELPIVQRTASQGSTVIDLTGATAQFVIQTLATTPVELLRQNATIVNPATSGVLQYAWTTTDTATIPAGVYASYFDLTYTGSKNLRVPNDGFMSLLITSPALGYATYSGDPSARKIDAVRFMVGDTDMSAPFCSDSEINYLLTETAQEPYAAAANLAEQIAARYSGKEDKVVGPLRLMHGQMAQRYYDLAKSIRERRRRKTGFTVQMTQTTDTHMFGIGQFDYPAPIDSAGNLLNANVSSYTWGATD